MYKLITQTVFFSLLMLGSVIAEEQSVKLSIPGMNCPVCPVTIKKSLQQVEGVKAVKIDYEAKTADVLFNDLYTNIGSLQEATKNVGYPSDLLVIK